MRMTVISAKLSFESDEAVTDRISRMNVIFVQRDSAESVSAMTLII